MTIGHVLENGLESQARAYSGPAIYADSCTSRDDKCRWTEIAEGCWKTECGEAHEFWVDGPTENKHRFCPYCGKRLEEAR